MKMATQKSLRFIIDMSDLKAEIYNISLTISITISVAMESCMITVITLTKGLS